MSFRTIQFPGMKISNINSNGDTANIEIDYAIIIKNMDNAEQDTRWYGKCLINVNELVIDSDDSHSIHSPSSDSISSDSD